MIKVTKRERESGERLLKRFSSHVKSRKLPQKFQGLRYFKQKTRKIKARQAAIVRSHHRKINQRRLFLSA